MLITSLISSMVYAIRPAHGHAQANSLGLTNYTKLKLNHLPTGHLQHIALGHHIYEYIGDAWPCCWNGTWNGTSAHTQCLLFD